MDSNERNEEEEEEEDEEEEEEVPPPRTRRTGHGNTPISPRTIPPIHESLGFEPRKVKESCAIIDYYYPEGKKISSHFSFMIIITRINNSNNSNSKICNSKHRIEISLEKTSC